MYTALFNVLIESLQIYGEEGALSNLAYGLSFRERIQAGYSSYNRYNFQNFSEIEESNSLHKFNAYTVGVQD